MTRVSENGSESAAVCWQLGQATWAGGSAPAGAATASTRRMHGPQTRTSRQHCVSVEGAASKQSVQPWARGLPPAASARARDSC